MKINFLLITLFCFTVSSKTIAQTEFKDGYIVSNEHERIDCQIRNTGHEESTMDYEYRLLEGGRVKEIELSKIEEFGIDNEIKCIRAFVAIDVSANTVLDKKDAIIKYEEGHVYLRSLFEGKLASLYTFFYEGNPIYYYSRGDKSIEPLVYKKYYIGSTASRAQDILNNNTYQDQLKENLSCGNSNNAKRVAYTGKDLKKYFTNYHICKNSEFLQLKTGPAKKGHLLIKPGIILSSTQLKIRQLEDNAPKVPFTKENNVNFGLELEYILPLNNYMWSVFTEANYLTYATDKVDSDDPLFKLYEIDYKTIEFPIGFGINFYGNKNHRFYLRAAFAPHYILGSSYISIYENEKTDLSVASRFLFGVGYNYKNLGIDFKYYTPQNLTQNIFQRGSKLQQLTLKATYSFQLFGDK